MTERALALQVVLGRGGLGEGGDLLLLTHAHLLSPGPLAAERGPGGRWAYRLADTPLVLVSDGGREKRLRLVAMAGDVLSQDTLRVGERR